MKAVNPVLPFSRAPIRLVFIVSCGYIAFAYDIFLPHLMPHTFLRTIRTRKFKIIVASLFCMTAIGMSAAVAAPLLTGAVTKNIHCGNNSVDNGRDGDGPLIQEQCDDGNRKKGDGCSPACKIEKGFHCPESGGSCERYCGNNSVDNGRDGNGPLIKEQCDDGNIVKGDGCSPACKIEKGFHCPERGGSCERYCGNNSVDNGRDGNGPLIKEQCDDGNIAKGDGCSPACKIEKGFRCPEGGGACTRK